MKKNVRLCVMLLNLFFAWTLNAQSEKNNCENCGNPPRKVELGVYPNPAQDFIGVTQEEVVGRICVFNMVGRRMKNFEVEKGEKYDISDLPHGMYLVQLVGKNNKVLTTQRLTKRT